MTVRLNARTAVVLLLLVPIVALLLPWMAGTAYAVRTTGTVEADEAGCTRSGTWTTTTHTGSNGNDYIWSSEAGAYVECAVVVGVGETGTATVYSTHTSSSHQTTPATVTLDDEPLISMLSYSSSTTTHVVKFTTPSMRAGSHNLRITVGAAGARINVDYLTYRTDDEPTLNGPYTCPQLTPGEGFSDGAIADCSPGLSASDGAPFTIAAERISSTTDQTNIVVRASGTPVPSTVCLVAKVGGVRWNARRSGSATNYPLSRTVFDPVATTTPGRQLKSWHSGTVEVVDNAEVWWYEPRTGGAYDCSTEPGPGEWQYASDPAPERSGSVPRLECTRVMRTAGGLWWVDLSGTILDAAEGDTYSWDVSWDANTYGSGSGLPGESRVTLQLPTDLSTLPAKGWSATFKVERTYGTGIAADTTGFDDVGGGDFLESDEPEAGDDDLFWGGSDWLELLSDLFLGTDYDPTSDLIGEYLDDFRSGYEFQREDGTYADDVADFSEVGGGDFTTVEAFCTVPVDPRRPESTPPIRVQPPTEDPPTADATGGECFQAESTDVSWDPRTWLRAAWNSALNVLQFVRSASCILKWAFIPPDGLPFSDLWCTRDGFGDPVSGLCAEFPFNALTEVTGSFDAFHDRLELAQANSPCATLDLRDVPPPIPGRAPDDLDFLNIKLPTPSSASCDGYAVSASAVAAEDQAGDLFGYREEFRLLLLVALWVAFAYKALRAFAPDGDKAEEIAP